MNNYTEIIRQSFSNCTITPMVSGGPDFGFVVPLLAFGISAFMIVILFRISASFAKYQRFIKVLRSIAATANYVAYGVLTFIVVVIPSMAGYWALNIAANDPGPFIEVLKWVGFIIAAYVGFAVLGYVTKKRVWLRLKTFKEQSKN